MEELLEKLKKFTKDGMLEIQENAHFGMEYKKIIIRDFGSKQAFCINSVASNNFVLCKWQKDKNSNHHDYFAISNAENEEGIFEDFKKAWAK